MTTPAISCEKCHGAQMQPRQVPRFGDGLRTIGVLLILASIGVLGFSALTVFLALGNTQDTDVVAAARRRTADQLLSYRHVPRETVETFERTGHLDRLALQNLTSNERLNVDRIMRDYEHAIGPQATPAAILGVGGCGFVALCIIFVPAIIVGGLLLRRRSVWWCSACGYVFDRA